MTTHAEKDRNELDLARWIDANLNETQIEILSSQRWFRSKEKQVSCLSLDDIAVVSDKDEDFLLLFVRFEFETGNPELYFVPLAKIKESSRFPDTAWKLGSEGDMWGAAEYSESFRSWLAKSFVNGTVVTTRKGSLSFRPKEKGALAAHLCEPVMSKCMNAEQSNTSLILQDKYMLKIYRKMEAGLNPEVEMLEALKEAGFGGVPGFAADAVYTQESNQVFSVACMTDFFRKECDGWEHFCSVIENGAEDGSLGQRAFEIGSLTAQMHLALASQSGKTGFSPEPFKAQEVLLLRDSFVKQAGEVLRSLESKRELLKGSNSEDLFYGILDRRSDILEKIPGLAEHAVKHGVHAVRAHGDYHLGQLLRKQGKWTVVDFEGEPLRGLEERKKKNCVLKDVAGMLRSFSYASAAGKKGKADNLEEGLRERFLSAYLPEITKAPIRLVPEDADARRELLDFFEMEKALYELSYELSNRPDWLHVPIKGIHDLLHKVH